MFENGGLEAGGEVLNKLFGKNRFFAFQKIARGSFKTGKTKIQISSRGHGFFEGIDRRAGFGHFGKDRTTRVAKSKHASNLIISFAGSVVESNTKKFIFPDIMHEHKLGVATGDDKT